MDGSEEMNDQLWEAVLDNDIETAKGLLDKGASVNTQDGLGITVLMEACWEKNKAMVDLLLKRGAEVNRSDYDGTTALMYAVIEGDEEITDLLLQCNADIMMKDCKGCTVFHFAAQQNRKTILNQLLVSHGTHWQLTVDVEDNYVCTPLYVAADYGCLDCVDVLLAHGANPEHKIHFDKSPLDIAKKKGHTRIVSMMTEAITIRSHRYVSVMMNAISILEQNNAKLERQIKGLEKEKKKLEEKLSQTAQQSEIGRLKSSIEQKDKQLKELLSERMAMRRNVEEEEVFKALTRSVMKHGGDQWYFIGVELGYNIAQMESSTQMVTMTEAKLHILIIRKQAAVGTKIVTDLLLKACKAIPYPIYEAVASDIGLNPM